MKKFIEIMQYSFWGMLTTIINFTCVELLCSNGMESLNANIIAWLLSNYVMYAGIKNRVFHYKTHGIKQYIVQLDYFYISRIVTLAFEEILIWKFVDIEGYPLLQIKIISAVLMGILNLVFSKIFIFSDENGKMKNITE